MYELRFNPIATHLKILGFIKMPLRICLLIETISTKNHYYHHRNCVLNTRNVLAFSAVDPDSLNSVEKYS